MNLQEKIAGIIREKYIERPPDKIGPTRTWLVNLANKIIKECELEPEKTFWGKSQEEMRRQVTGTSEKAADTDKTPHWEPKGLAEAVINSDMTMTEIHERIPEFPWDDGTFQKASEIESGQSKSFNQAMIEDQLEKLKKDEIRLLKVWEKVRESQLHPINDKTIEIFVERYNKHK